MLHLFVELFDDDDDGLLSCLLSMLLQLFVELFDDDDGDEI